MPAKFLYQLEGSTETKEYPFPEDSPITWPPVGALFIAQDGGHWRCLGPSETTDPATEQPKAV